MTYTRQDIYELLDKNDKAVERAILRIYYNQTREEQIEGKTVKHNNRGFNKVHANIGTYLATWILNGKHLSGRFLTMARKMAKFYARQLVQYANSK